MVASSLFEKIRNPLETFWSLSLGLRILVGSLLGALGGSTLIGFLAELGAVNYALAYGARLPTEGVPFLRYATTAISLGIFSSALLVFLVLNFVVRGSIKQFLSSGSVQALGTENQLGDVPLQKYLLLGSLPAIAATQGFFQLLFILMPRDLLPQWAFAVFALFVAALILLLARKPQWTKWFIAGVFGVAVTGFFCLAFTPVLYGRALNFARQGGEVHVVLEIDCSSRTACATEVSGLLFLRTTDSFVLREPATQRFREIPGRLVEAIRYTGEDRWGTR